MEWYHQALVTMTFIALLLAWNVPRAAVWAGCGVFSYVTSAWWHNAGLDHGELYGAATNLIFIGLIWRLGATRWETKLMAAFCLMILVDALYAFGVIKTPYLFAGSLEAINAYCLLLIWVTGFTERITRNGFFSRYPYRALLDHIHHSLFGQRKAYPRWWRHP